MRNKYNLKKSKYKSKKKELNRTFGYVEKNELPRDKWSNKDIVIELDEEKIYRLHVKHRKGVGFQYNIEYKKLPDNEARYGVTNINNILYVMRDVLDERIMVYFEEDKKAYIYSDGSVDTSHFQKLNKVQVAQIINQYNLRDYEKVKTDCSKFKPTADFHTHLETALSTESLIQINMLDALVLDSKTGKINSRLFELIGFDKKKVPEALDGILIDLEILKEKYHDVYEKLVEKSKPTLLPLDKLQKIFKGIIDFEKDSRFFEENENGEKKSCFDSTIVKKNEEVKAISFSMFYLKLTEEERIKFDSLLSFKTYNQGLFSELSERISNRLELNKDFELLLNAIAYEYKEQGVDYAELSTSKLVNSNKSDIWRSIQKCVPEIEERLGVQLRFLASFDRDEKRKIKNKMNNFKKNYESEEKIGQDYIVGFDVSGYEKLKFKNETLKMIFDYIMEKKSNLTMRLHAGENSYPHENVYNALAYIKNSLNEYYRNADLDEEKYMPKIRIGHGIYLNDYDDKRDKETIELIKEMNVVVEINMSSNYLLNNINFSTDNPIKKYLDEGVLVVLGTDGHGMYRTTINKEVSLIGAAGVGDEYAEKLKLIEFILKNGGYYVSFDQLKGNYQEMSDEINERKKDVLLSKLNSKGFGIKVLCEENNLNGDRKRITNESILNEMANTFVNGQSQKVPIVISGASKSKWEVLSPREQEKIMYTMQLLVDVIDPEKAYFVTGGTNFGVEKQLHLANSLSEKKKDVLGVFALEAIDDIDKIEKDTISHAVIVRKGDEDANFWQEAFPNFNAMIAKRLNGDIIVCSGGDVVQSIIEASKKAGLGGKRILIKSEDRAARIVQSERDYESFLDDRDLVLKDKDDAKINGTVYIDGKEYRDARVKDIGVAFRSHMHLMEGIEGASGDKAKLYKGRNFGFKSSKQLIRRLYDNYGKDIFVDGFEIDKIDDYTKASKIAVIQRNREKNKKPSKLDELRKLILGVKSKQIIESKKELIDVEEKEKKDIEQECR